MAADSSVPAEMSELGRVLSRIMAGRSGFVRVDESIAGGGGERVEDHPRMRPRILE